MYVICAGMLRSCSTWQYMVVSDLVEQVRKGTRHGFVDVEQYRSIKAEQQELEHISPAYRNKWRVIKVHEEHEEFARDLEAGRALAVYSYRDLRDVTFSLMRLRQISFEEAVFEYKTLEAIIRSHAFWMSQPNTLVQQYEILVNAPEDSIQKISRHLRIPLQTGACSSLALQYSLDANRQRTQVLAARLEADGLDLLDPVNRESHDEESCLHWNHIWEGRVGIWRQLATEKQCADFARVIGPWLVEHGYERENSWKKWRIDPSARLDDL